MLNDQSTMLLPAIEATPRGERAPKFTPYAVRVAYAGTGRHHAKPQRGSLGKWFRSRLRDLGDSLVGVFVGFASA